nr:integrase, catalytic region, zinc finger, CCHC-type, peptidase aspartic, catalytic [Tanacetum cinerariifolium]
MLLIQTQENRVALDAKQLLFLAGGPDNAFDDDVDEQPVQNLALNVDNVFQAEDCDAFESDVDEAPTAQTMFMANLSSTDPITDEAGPSYDLDILSEVRDDDQYLDDTCMYQEDNVMHDSVQLDHVVDLHADHTSISNMISYNQYVKDIDVSVIHNHASSVLNDTFMIIYDDMCESITPSVSNSSWNAVVKNSLTAELANYREQVELPRPMYNDRNKVAISYKNPLCLTRAKQAQPALYNGHEILKDNHAQAKVHNTEDTLEIVEITRKKINAKMTGPECVTHKVKIAPHDYSKENLLATFTPQKQLTPEQIYWSNDLMTLKSKALKEWAKVSRPIKVFTVNNRDAHLDYLRHLKESVETIHDIVEEAKVVRPLDRSIASACRYTQHSQELLEYTIGTCPQGSQQRAKQLAHTPLIRKKQDTVTKPSNRQDSNKNKHVVTQKIQKTNVPVPHSTGVNRCPKAGGSQPKRNHKTNRISPAKGDNKMPVKDLPMTNKSHLRTTNHVDSNSRLKRTFDSEMTTLLLSWVMVITWLVKALSLRVFGALCYPTNDSEDLRKLQPTADTGIFVGYAPSRKGTRSYFFDAWINKLRPCTQFDSCNSLCTPTNKELEILFQPMFDEYLEPPQAERPDSPAQAVQVLVSSVGTPLSTTIDQDAPSPYISPSFSALQSHSLPQGVVAEPHFMEDHNVAPVDHNPFVNVFAPKPHLVKLVK